ncbi:Uncharacterized conserved protein YdeI, YjbR/CyaY-like superfamily, DUF1801 family [Cognatiyoonia koreensis]|uniref:Uncharacterized conserved protein YdeI, YjbR/CyaY-like superfamily, DUF1801 family n=1 Tax=Cognatiyoonia koreensis TaxID=364200 RepID=A0A1I0RY05_9RHOB|nr:YdeI/OmpD-associated family protein [Cognatiyoonia koreensis]SEW45764.1 Uncharacterized conserved protein YdeI, YjbR/CyaY-like superfamily, DUF1801 family [Cognatiyoonia koreensis]
MIRTENFAQVEVTSGDALHRWLLDHHAQMESVWLVTFKKSEPDKYLDRFAVLDELLCFGWIDGIRRKLDDARTMQLISPRKEQTWAQTYKDRVARLRAEGRMHPAGEAAIAHSKELGKWDEMADVDALIVPDDLLAALQAYAPADVHFTNFSPSSRRNMLRWLKQAKTGPTRVKRIAQIATLAARNEKVPQM